LRTIFYGPGYDHIVGDTALPEEGVRLATALRPNAIFITAHPTGMTVVELCRCLHDLSVESKLVVLGEGLDPHTCLLLGQVPVDGFLAWENLNADVCELTLRGVLRGLRISNVAIVDKVLTPRQMENPKLAQDFQLTDRERNVLEGLTADLSEKEIAIHHHVSVRTVQDTVSRLKAKLEVNTVAGLAARATALGFVGQA
jgi:two-component system nitrate/nitrite response regulator NarL